MHHWIGDVSSPICTSWQIPFEISPLSWDLHLLLVVCSNRERWCRSVVNCDATCDDPALMFIKLNTSSASLSTCSWLFKSGAKMHHCSHPYRRMHHHPLIIIIIIIMFLVFCSNRERWCSSVVNCDVTCDYVYPALMFIKLNTSSSSSSMFLVV